MALLPPSDPALIEVRHDERLDLTHLEPWLRTHLPHTDGPLSVRQFGGGRANLTYLVRFDAHEYVLRRPPFGPIAPTSHDMQREHRVLKQLGTAFPLAPTSFALCDDPAVLGVDFHVMERRHGIVIRGELPTIVQRDPAIARRLGEMIIDALADLHRVNPETVGLGTLGHPDGFVTRQLSGWTQRWHAAKDRDMSRWTASAPGCMRTCPPHTPRRSCTTTTSSTTSWSRSTTPPRGWLCSTETCVRAATR